MRSRSDEPAGTRGARDGGRPEHRPGRDARGLGCAMSSTTSRRSNRRPAGNRATRSPSRTGMSVEDDFEPLSRAERREIERRVRDSRDPVRYMIVSALSRRFILYYNVLDDVYAVNHPVGGTLFKRKKAASAVSRLLGGRCRIIQVSAKGGRIKWISPYGGGLRSPGRGATRRVGRASTGGHDEPQAPDPHSSPQESPAGLSRISRRDRGVLRSG